MTFPTLYKRSSTGALLEWTIRADRDDTLNGLIVTRHGQFDGAIQEARDRVVEGKNLGKKNETTPLEQAQAEAKARWEKQIARKGYTPDRAKAEAGQSDQEGGITPMLAKAWDAVEKRFKFPADAQRKLDGVRNCAVVQDGKVTLWSRQRAPITGVPHVIAAIERMDLGNAVLDGELFKLGLGFQRITSFVRQQEPKQGHEQIEFHVYDAPGDQPWYWRRNWLQTLPWNDVVRPVATITVDSFAHARTLHDQWVQEGYEGLMLRSLDGRYKAGRSGDLVKVKVFQEAEAKIVAVNAGRGKFAGLAVFTCQMPDGKTFDCCAPGTLEDRAEYFRQRSELLGGLLTYKFFESTDDGLPRFPVGKGVRWEKDL